MENNKKDKSNGISREFTSAEITRRWDKREEVFTKIPSVDNDKMKDQDESHIKRWRTMNLIRTARERERERMTDRAEKWKNRVKRIEEVQVDQIKRSTPGNTEPGRKQLRRKVADRSGRGD